MQSAQSATAIKYVRNKAAKLAPGHTLPSKPVYWMIWVLKDGKPHHSRTTFNKWGTPREACREAYGMDPTENMLFFNMTPRVTDMRRMLKQTRVLWTEMGGFSG